MLSPFRPILNQAPQLLMTVEYDINTPLLVIGCCRCRNERMDCNALEPHVLSFGHHFTDFSWLGDNSFTQRYFCGGLNCDILQLLPTPAPFETSKVWRMLVCCSANPRRNLLLWVRLCADKRLAYSFFLSLAVSCSDLRKHCSSEKWWSDFDGWNLTLLAKNCRCSDPLIFDLRVLIPRVQTAAAHAHASFTLQLHLLVLPAPVSTPILFNSLVAFIFTHLQCLCWK